LTRPFSIQDIVLVQKLQDKGTRFDLPERLIRPRSPLQLALLSYLLHREWGADTCVLAGYSDQRSLRGFVQVRPRPNRPEWDIICLAPSLESDATASLAWEYLLQYICRAAGEEGVLRLFAKVPENAPATEIFRALDFHPYAHEDLFWHESSAAFRVLQPPTLKLRSWRAEDDWRLHHLYIQVTPANVQIAEGFSSSNAGRAFNPEARRGSEEEHVMEAHGEIRGYLGLSIGTKGYGLRIVLHPGHVDKSEELLLWSLSALKKRPPHPVYCSVRQYEKGMQDPLRNRGFDLLASQVLMVKQLAVRFKEPVHKLVSALEKRVETAPTRTCEEYVPKKA